MRSRSQWLSTLLALAAFAARPCPAAELRDLYFGEAVYQAYQGQFFDALERHDMMTTYAVHFAQLLDDNLRSAGIIAC